MDAKRLVVGTIVGAVVMHLVGYLIFNVIAEGFYAANMTAVPGVFLDPQIQWAIIAGEVAASALLTLGIMSRRSGPSLASGAIAGVVVGFLLWAAADYVYYGLANVWTLTIVIIDPFIEAVHFAVTGAVVGFVVAKVPAGSG